MSLARLAGCLVLLLVAAACRPESPGTDSLVGPGSSVGPPTDLSAAPLDPGRIELSWSAPSSSASAVASYRLYRDGEVVAEPDSSAHTDEDLSPYTRYEYRVTAVDSSGAESEPTASHTARTLDGSAPGPPEDLEASARGSAVRLAWSAASDEETGIRGYRIYRNGSPVDSTEGTSYEDTGLSPGTEYVYEVSAVNGDGLEGETSGRVEARTGEGDDEDDDSPPSAPDDLDADVEGPTEIELSWSEAEDPESGISGYRVYRDGELVGRPDDTEFDDDDLEPDTEYLYRVSAVNGDGVEGPSSGPASATTEEGDDEDEDSPPPAPDEVEAEAKGSTEIEVKWKKVEDPESGIASYRVYRGGAVVGATDDDKFREDGLEPGTEYTYRVSAVNGEGVEGEPSEPVSATTEEDDSPPSAPDDLDADGRNPNVIDLSWDAAEDPESGIAGYRVYRDGEVVGTTGGTEFADDGLERGTEYSYEVSAVNGAGLEGPRSDEAEARTDDPGGGGDDDDDD